MCVPAVQVSSRFVLQWIYGRLLPQGIRPAAREHDVISRAIQDGDAAAARSAVEANWANAARRLARAIGKEEAAQTNESVNT
jgi:DNA-binding FadR family transcriptional regulator